MNGHSMTAGTMMDMTERNYVKIICTNRHPGTGTTMMDLSGSISQPFIAADNTIQIGNAR